MAPRPGSALDPLHSDTVSVSTVSLPYCSDSQVALEELQDLKGVWSELSKVWEQIDQMKEQPWVSVQPRKVHLSSVRVCLQALELQVSLETHRMSPNPRVSFALLIHPNLTFLLQPFFNTWRKAG